MTIEIDLDCRVGSECLSRTTDANGPITVGQHVIVHDPKTGTYGPAEVVEVVAGLGVVFLKLPWFEHRLEAS